MEDSTQTPALPILLQELMMLIEGHRSVFRQERTFLRAMAVVLGELFAFARHTVTQVLLALGRGEEDWSATYRLFSRGRFAEPELARCFFRETLRHGDAAQPYPLVLDATQIPRSSLKMPGTSWLKAPRTPPFRVGIHRAQRFEHGAWLVPLEEGYSRAIPLRFLPCFPEKAVPAEGGVCKEWEAGLVLVRWVRGELDVAGRERQPLIVLGDGRYDTLDFWRGLPERTVLGARSARNRCLYWLPGLQEGPGRPRLYGERALSPAGWLHVSKGWSKTQVLVRGRMIPLTYRVEGPFLRDGLPDYPLFLIVVRGSEWKVGKRKPHRKRRDPAFYLVSAVEQDGQWRLPFDAQTWLSWFWQRWEIEVAHREMKSGLGVGEKQCWGKRSAVVAVQWSVWVYALLVLAGYRAWGLLGGPPAPARWWGGARRWSLNTLWRGFRAALWGTGTFRAACMGTRGDWLEKGTCQAILTNAAATAARA